MLVLRSLDLYSDILDKRNRFRDHEQYCDIVRVIVSIDRPHSDKGLPKKNDPAHDQRQNEELHSAHAVQLAGTWKVRL